MALEKAEKIFFHVQNDDLNDLKKTLLEQSPDEIKVILELIVKVIVWTNDNNLRDGVSSLHYAAKRGRVKHLKEMLRHEGTGKYRLDLDLQSSLLGWSPLHYAAYSGHVPVTKLLLGRLAKVDTRSKDKTTPLHISIQAGMKYVTAVLVNNGADPNLQDSKGMTPLHYAVHKDTLTNNKCPAKHTRDIVDFLLRKQADISISNNDGETPLHLALNSSVDQNIIKLLAVQMKKNNTPLKENRFGLSAIHICRSVSSLQLLISAGASIDQLTADGRTCLHICSNDFDCVQFLVSKGADKTIKDKQGRIPLHSAVTQSRPCLDTIKLLAGEYTLVNAVDKNGMTPLHLLCLNKYTVITMSDNKKTIKEQTIGSNNDPILEYLVNNGADVDAQNIIGQTPLHLALKHKLYDKATYLLINGANLDIDDHRHVTPRKLNPGWARKSLSLGGGTSTRMRASTLASQSPIQEIKYKHRKSPLPKWVTSSNIQTDFAREPDALGSPDRLSRELTQLQDDVKDVKRFLETFSAEGKKDARNSITSTADIIKNESS